MEICYLEILLQLTEYQIILLQVCLNPRCVFFYFLADFGDYDQYESQEFLQRFALFPVVSTFD